MSTLEMIHQDSTFGEASRELDETVYEENPILQYPYRGDSIPYPHIIGSSDILPSTREQIMAVGYPSNVKENIFEGYGFVGEFNPKYGMSNWVSECLTKDQQEGNYIGRKDSKAKLFYEDKDTYFEKIVTLADYEGQEKYVRGHLAAAGNHRYNSVAYRNTFCLKNITPMHNKVNQILGCIEKQGQRFLKHHKKVYSITGPVFYPKRAPIFIKEGSKVRVPDAFFKVLAHEHTHKKKKIHRVYGYIVQNYPDDHEETKENLKNIRHARRRLSSINKETGLNILSKVQSKIIDDNDLEKASEQPDSALGEKPERATRGHGV